MAPDRRSGQQGTGLKVKMAYDAEPWGEQPIFPHCPGCGKVILPDEKVTIIHYMLFHMVSASEKWHSTCSQDKWMPEFFKKWNNSI